MKRLMLEITIENNAPLNPKPELESLILMELDNQEDNLENSYWCIERGNGDNKWWYHFKCYEYFSSRERWFDADMYHITCIKAILVDL